MVCGCEFVGEKWRIGGWPSGMEEKVDVAVGTCLFQLQSNLDGSSKRSNKNAGRCVIKFFIKDFVINSKQNHVWIKNTT
jgi:hypothetical protein